jgi:cysteine desulfuration protein SufE
MNEQTFIPPRLAEIVAEFRTAGREEKLELLLEFSEQLPPLPPDLKDHQGMEQVHECMSPVFVVAQREGERIVYHIDVPPEAPTIRGFAAILRTGLEGFHPTDGAAPGPQPATAQWHQRTSCLSETSGAAPDRAR